MLQQKQILNFSCCQARIQLSYQNRHLFSLTLESLSYLSLPLEDNSSIIAWHTFFLTEEL